MSYSIWGFIAELPWWLYLVLLLLINVSYQATKPRHVSLKAFIALPVVIIIMLIVSMCLLVTFDLYKFSLLFGGLVPGALLGWLQFRIRNIKALKNESQFYVPGTWSLFLIIFTLLALRFYYFGFDRVLDRSILKQENVLTLLVGLSGIVIGLSIGRLLYLYRTMKHGPFVDA